MSRKERKKEKKITFSADVLCADVLCADMLCADVLCADALACGRGRVACRCTGMWTWMCCVWMRMSRKEKKKEKNLLLVRTCCVWMRMSRKERKKKTYFSADADEWKGKKKKKKKNLLQCRRGHVGVCCVRVRMSRKEKEKTYFNMDGWIADVLCVDALACGHRWR